MAKTHSLFITVLLIASDATEAGQPFHIHAPSYAPLACSSEPFTDVPISSEYCPWIRLLKADGITGGCGGGKYCPGSPVTREQMAVLLGRVLRDGTKPSSLFSRFAGTGTVARSVNGFEVLGALRIEYASLTVPFGSTLVLEQGAGYIAVQGSCDISGTIQVATLASGGSSDMGGSGLPGRNGAGALGPAAVPYCLGGAGGVGGEVGGATGGLGGGAAPPAPFQAITFAAGFPNYLLCGGGGGGGGGTTNANGFGGSGGGGGGIVYLECGDLFFTGTVEAKGGPGEPGEPGRGAGGGGGGGVIVLRSRRTWITSGTMNASGGLDGGLMNNGSPGANGFTSLETLEMP